MDRGEEVGCCFEVSGCDASEVFEAVEEALDQVAVAIEVAIDGADDADVALAWDVGGGTGGFDGLGYGAAEVAAIGDDITAQGERSKQVWRSGLVRGLTWGERKADRQATAVDNRVDLAGQSPTGATDGVIRTPFLPPAACWCARTMELSIRCRLSGETVLSRSKMASHTPCLAHRL